MASVFFNASISLWKCDSEICFSRYLKSRDNNYSYCFKFLLITDRRVSSIIYKDRFLRETKRKMASILSEGLFPVILIAIGRRPTDRDPRNLFVFLAVFHKILDIKRFKF